MTITKHGNLNLKCGIAELDVTKLDQDKEIRIEVTDHDITTSAFLTIEQTKELIEYLRGQVIF
ncbi:MAG: hypothetical protein AABY22_22475 [Nanoarchaeota archaeon]